MQGSLSLSVSSHPTAPFFTRAFVVLLLVIATQNILAMLVAKHIAPLAPLIFATKELYLATIVAIATVSIVVAGHVHRELVAPFAMLVYVLVVAVVASPFLNLVSLRQAVVIPVFLICGFYYAGRVDLRDVSRWVFNIYVLVVVLGFVERFVLYNETESFFHAIGVREWSEVKGWGYRIPNSWYSADLLVWMGARVRRMPGLLIGDAVNFGQALAFPFLMAVTARRYWLAVLAGLAMLVGMSKGGLLAAIAGTALYLSFERFDRWQRYVFWAVSIAALAAAVLILLDLIVQVRSVMDHLRGGVSNTTNIIDNLWGRGVGSGGNFGRRFNLQGTDDAIGLSSGRLVDVGGLAYGESYFGTMLAQFGILGLLMYAYYPIRLIRHRVPKGESFLMAVKYTTLGLFVVGLFSETAFTYVGTGFIIALVPFVLQTRERMVNVVSEEQRS